MDAFNVYRDISERTNGDIYIGVVGPVRTGKSTFIKKFMDLMVIPNIEDPFNRERAKDELPQSAGGRSIMTTEPKFVPNEAVKIKFEDNVEFKVRMIDCVGYLVPGASGYMEEDAPRMIYTPWHQEPIPFAEAAEIGTKKVINEHSTIGIVVTTDGSITEIPREDYVESEERVVKELKEINKPFVIILNTTKLYAEETDELRDELCEKYQVPVLAVNCAQLKYDDINNILERILFEFPVREIKLHFPKWVETLEINHWLKKDIINASRELLKNISKLREVKDNIIHFENNNFVKKVYIENIDLGSGSTAIEITTDESLFYRVLSETTEMAIENEYQLISTIKTLAEIKREYDKVEVALNEVKRKGYGVVTPMFDEMKLEEPAIIRQGARYGIRLKAVAPSLHMIRADIETEVSPIVGTEEQSKELVADLMREFDQDPMKIWDLNIFGKTLNDMISEGMQNKLYRMPEDAQMKLQETLQKIINEGSGGLICIIL